MKRVLALIALMGVVGLTVGCGGGSTAQQGNQGPPPVVGGKQVEGLKEPAQPKAFD